eukprot:TRINITY_DN9217_c0_g1_i1.p1 TRINITY_DN9217_c0_g1~~TRINITY_DN9217_c0_g1_i1.p1  ORF type:complete len:152 (-),score=52.05 TRINITY_DN9217_c0_g1_i1:180-635(-)
MADIPHKSSREKTLKQSVDLSSSFRQALSATSSPSNVRASEGKRCSTPISPFGFNSPKSYPIKGREFKMEESEDLSDPSSFSLPSSPLNDRTATSPEGRMRSVSSTSDMESVMSQSRQMEIQEELDDLDSSSGEEDAAEERKKEQVNPSEE